MTIALLSLESVLIMRFTDNLENILCIISEKIELGANLIGIFLYGSQNYNLDTQDSDIDVIVLVHENQCSHQTIQTLKGDIKIYTLKYFLYRLKKVDLECLEILFTTHYYINPLYKLCFMQFSSGIEAILTPTRIQFALKIKLDEHLSHVRWMMCNPYRARYNHKRLYRALRVHNQMVRMREGESFQSSLPYVANLPYDIMAIKTIVNFLSPTEFNELFKLLVSFLHDSQVTLTSAAQEEQLYYEEFYKKIYNLYLTEKEGAE